MSSVEFETVSKISVVHVADAFAVRRKAKWDQLC